MSKRPDDTTVREELANVLAGLPQATKNTFADLRTISTFQKLDGGYANLVYDINGAYILRVFFREGWDKNFRNEHRALTLLRKIDHVPKIISHGTLPLEWDCPYLLLSKLPGTNAFAPWAEADPGSRSAWAATIAATLQQVHEIPIRHYGLLSGGEEATSVAPENWQSYQDKKFTSLLDNAYAQSMTETARHRVRQVETYYAAHRHVLAVQRGPCLVHGDLRLHNIIVNDAQVTGLIDWEWAHGGEPEADLVNMIRFTLFPEHESSLQPQTATRKEYAPLLRLLLSAYPELASVPHFSTRLTLYLMAADLGQLCVRSELIQHHAATRLSEWLKGAFVHEWITDET